MEKVNQALSDIVSPSAVAPGVSSPPGDNLKTPSRSLNIVKTPKRLTSSSTKVSTRVPKSANSKTAWTVIQLKMHQKINIYLMCKQSNGKIGPFTSAPSASKTRPMWEPINLCEYKVETDVSGSKRLFQFRNIDNESAQFRADTFDPLLVKTNLFTQKQTALLMSNPNLLALYLSLLSCSEEYVGHDINKHDKNGFNKDESVSGEELIVRAGGSLSEYEEFRKAAISNAPEVSGALGEQATVKMSPASRKRKVTDFFTPVEKKKKLSKTDTVELNYREMIAADAGMEKSAVSAYIGVELVPLDKLQLSPDIFLPISQKKVNDLVESMTDRLEVSQLVVSVVPADLDRFVKDGENDKFWVVHGVHRLLAMKKLDILNKINPIPGFPSSSGMLCFILQVDSPSLTNYVNIKCNDLAQGFQSRSSNESLLFVFKGLVNRMQDKYEALEVVEKICHSRHLKSKELAVYRKIAEWPGEVLDLLIELLEKFQTYQTKDCTSHGSKERRKRREPNTMTDEMFRQLGDCKPEFFKEHQARVLSNACSLKEILEQSREENKLGMTEKKVVACAAGNESIDSLKKKFPDSFSPDIVKQYTKAEIGRKRNPLGKRLNNYVKSVQQGSTFEEPVKFKTFQAWGEISTDKLKENDVIVLHVCKDNLEWVKCWIDSLCGSSKDFYSVLVILESESLLQDIYKSLDTWNGKPDFQNHLCIFKKEKSAASSENVNENAIFSVLLGKLNIFKGPLMTLNESLSKDLIKVVEKVTPPSGKVAYVSMGDKKVIKIHSDEQKNVEVTYFVTETELSKVQDKFLVERSEPEKVAKLSPTNRCQGNDSSSVKDSSQKGGSENGEESVEEEFNYKTDEDEFNYGTDDGGDSAEDEEVEETESTQGDMDQSDLTKQPSTSATTYC